MANSTILAYKNVYFIYLLLVFIYSAASDTCVKHSPCSCQFSNGTGVDLSPSAGKLFYNVSATTTNSEKYTMIVDTYYFHPCGDIQFNDFDNLTNVTGSCNQSLAICLRTYKIPKDNKIPKTIEYRRFASYNESNFSDDGQNLIFKEGSASTTVKLVCSSDGKNHLNIDSTEDPEYIKLSYASTDACFKQLADVNQRSAGATLLIIFFSLTIVYLVLGVCTKKFLMGAQGIEVLPNITFWLDLPNLVKDGWMFLRNGCKVPASDSGFPTSPDPNSYDSI